MQIERPGDTETRANACLITCLHERPRVQRAQIACLATSEALIEAVLAFPNIFTGVNIPVCHTVIYFVSFHVIVIHIFL